MPNIKISALASATVANNADTLAIVQSGITKKITVDVLLDTSDARTTVILTNEFSGGFHTPTLLNEFTVGATPIKIFGVGYQQAQVYFSGALQCEGVVIPSTGLIAFRLPTPYRSKAPLRYSVITSDGDSFIYCGIEVRIDGNVVVYPNGVTPAGTQSELNLAPISYYIS